ncbi:inositol monophosphatase family protein [Microbispora hainanensis]|uniref:Inositol monophosphatase family protein n=2 Tax=Microbispora hainanensis TaxID=568844 RepID=A0A544YZV1_9ACTN|nr:inositol monophosphatase family protein [Microbispora hainanensis]
MWGTSLTRFAKSADDFATVADIEAEKAILGVIRAARPDDAVTGEETGRTGRDGAERMWLVDPLCGTLNYAARTMLVGVNVALRTGSAVTAAACADPFTGEVFWTDGAHAYVRRDAGAAGAAGGGGNAGGAGDIRDAWGGGDAGDVGDAWGEGDTGGAGDAGGAGCAGEAGGAGGTGDERLTPSAESRLVDVNLDPPFPNAPAFRAAALLADPGFAERFRPRVVSTTLAVAWVAAGRRAAYVTDGHLRDSVHFASGIALCQAAGCVVTGIRGEPLHTGAGGLVVAADRETHRGLLEIIARAGR